MLITILCCREEKNILFLTYEEMKQDLPHVIRQALTLLLAHIQYSRECLLNVPTTRRTNLETLPGRKNNGRKF
jgi:hypothetical protein